MKTKKENDPGWQTSIRFGFILALLGLLLAPLAHAQPQLASSLPVWNETGGLNFFSGHATNPDLDWKRMALIAITICLLANTLLFVAARVIGSQSLEHFAVSEFFQVTASALMVVGLVVLVGGAFSLLQFTAILPEKTTTECAGVRYDVWQNGPMPIIQCKVQEKITYVEALYNQAWLINRDVEPATTVIISVFMVPIYNGDWDIDRHYRMESAHLIASRVVPIAISLHAQYMFVGYLAQNMLAVFLPVGLLLRIFPFLRGIGGLMVAMSIGFYMVFPIAYILMDPTTVRPAASQLLPAPPASLNVCYASFSGVVSAITQTNLGGAAPGAAPPPNLDQLGQQVAQLQVEAFFNPLAALAATLVFISAAAPILGGDSGEIMRFVARVI